MLEFQRKYENALETFKNRLLHELGDTIQSIIVYGSMARGEVTIDSDIDMLVVSRDEGAGEKVSDIGYEVDFENDFETLIMPIHLTDNEFKHRVKVGSPFILEILKEGVILYDDGTFKRIRDKMFGAGK